jgi:hypothetical protein
MTAVTPPGMGTVDVSVTGFISGDTLPAAYTYTGGGSGGAFVDVGPGVGGSLGAPTLSGAGDLTPGSATGFTLTIANCPPGAFGVYFWSLGPGGALPFKQGTFYPVPILFQLAFNLGPGGSVVLPLAFDAGVPGGIQLTTQWWCQDATAPAGAGGSNGLRLDLP